jgi:hypothetical protein
VAVSIRQITRFGATGSGSKVNFATEPTVRGDSSSSSRRPCFGGWGQGEGMGTGAVFCLGLGLSDTRQQRLRGPAGCLGCSIAAATLLCSNPSILPVGREEAKGMRG